MNSLPDSESITSKVLVKAKTSKDLLDSNEESLFDIFKSIAHTAKHTVTGRAVVQMLDQISIELSLDFEGARKYFEQNSPYVPKTFDVK